MQGINIQPQFFNIAPTGVNIQPQGASIGPSLIVIGPYDTTVAGQVSSHCITQGRPCRPPQMSILYSTMHSPHCMPQRSPWKVCFQSECSESAIPLTSGPCRGSTLRLPLSLLLRPRRWSILQGRWLSLTPWFRSRCQPCHELLKALA